jgi:parallel beta-helix repeat protein
MKRITFVLLAVVMSACLNQAASAQEGTVDSAKPINTCTTITQPGSYWVVNNITIATSNVQTDSATGALACIVITADFVTLDLGGHTLFGPAGGRLNGIGVRGIFSFHNNFIEVRSGAVTSLYDGIALYGSGETVEHIRVSGALNVGIFVGIYGSGGHRVVGNTAMNNWDGIVVDSCPAVVLENSAAGNTNLQIYEVAGCTSSENSPAP